MKKKSLLFSFFWFVILALHAQGLHQYSDSINHFSFSYAASVRPVILMNNEDIKGQVDSFDVEVVSKTINPASVNPDSVADDCYQFMKDLHLKNKITFNIYSCNENAAGHSYYNYIFLLKGRDKNIYFKFLNVACNGCTDDKGKPVVFDEDKSMQWIFSIVKSVQYTP
jgi:hypothetical protein